MNRNCQLKVEKLKLVNFDEIEDLNIQWKYNKESKELEIEVTRDYGTTFKESKTRITTALRDYGEWY